MKEKDKKRFWSKVRKRGKDECWEWAASCSQFGYGWFSYKGKAISAHRFALRLKTNENRKGMYAMHSCDNPKCCNPKHLSWGTPADNIHDAMSKGRHVKPPLNKVNPPIHKGTDNPMAVLTPTKVRTIRKMKNKGMSVNKIASHYEISKSTVYQVVNNITWNHV